ncbi:MAG: magnesium transporter [Selenomonadales bacterium]|nr:magnesium transporter [Selenomonadales bacterium]
MEKRIVDTVNALMADKNWEGLRAAVTKLPYPDIAEVLAEVGKTERVLIYRILPRELAAEVAAYLEPDDLHFLIQELSDAEARHLIASLRPDDRTFFLGELPGQVTQHILNLLSPDDLREARELLGYPEHSVGRLMTPEYVAVRPTWTVEQVLGHIRQRGRDSETINTLYVTDERWYLYGAVDLKHIILAAPTAQVSDLMRTPAISLNAFSDQEIAVATMQRHDAFALPVVNTDGVLVGIVTFDDMMDVAQTEATEDFHRAAAIAPLEDVYTATGIVPLVKKRMGWLLGLIIVNLMSSGVIAVFEETLSATIALAFFMPLLIDSGGNIGSQAATMMIRGLVTGDLTLGRWATTLAKEAAVGGLLGLLMGGAAAVLGFYRGGYELALVIGLTMVLMAVMSNLVGAALPFVFKRLRIDPAVASGPLITTVADTVGLVIYFTIARMVLA